MLSQFNTSLSGAEQPGVLLFVQATANRQRRRTCTDVGIDNIESPRGYVADAFRGRVQDTLSSSLAERHKLDGCSNARFEPCPGVTCGGIRQRDILAYAGMGEFAGKGRVGQLEVTGDPEFRQQPP